MYEHDIIKGCLKNSRSSQKDLYALFYGKMMGVCYGILATLLMQKTYYIKDISLYLKTSISLTKTNPLNHG